MIIFPRGKRAAVGVAWQVITCRAADDYLSPRKRAEVGSYGVCAVTTIETHSLTQLSYTLLQFDAIDYTLSSHR